MNQNQLSVFINQQIEVAVGIEKVRMAEKYISEKQMNFEMQYAIDLLHQALCGFEKLMGSQQKSKESEFQNLGLEDLSWLEAK